MCDQKKFIPLSTIPLSSSPEKCREFNVGVIEVDPLHGLNFEILNLALQMSAMLIDVAVNGRNDEAMIHRMSMNQMRTQQPALLHDGNALQTLEFAAKMMDDRFMVQSAVEVRTPVLNNVRHMGEETLAARSCRLPFAGDPLRLMPQCFSHGIVLEPAFYSG